MIFRSYQLAGWKFNDSEYGYSNELILINNNNFFPVHNIICFDNLLINLNNYLNLLINNS